MGHSRYAAPDILKTAGLTTNARVTPAEMIEACKSLRETGLFEKVSYEYKLDTGDAGPGYQLTLQLVENPKLYQVKIAVPGMNESELWAELKSRSPLFGPEMPITSESWLIGTLQQVLEDRGLSERLTARLQTDSRFSGTIEVVLVPKPASIAPGL